MTTLPNLLMLGFTKGWFYIIGGINRRTSNPGCYNNVLMPEWWHRKEYGKINSHRYIFYFTSQRTGYALHNMQPPMAVNTWLPLKTSSPLRQGQIAMNDDDYCYYNLLNSRSYLCSITHTRCINVMRKKVLLLSKFEWWWWWNKVWY